MSEAISADSGAVDTGAVDASTGQYTGVVNDTGAGVVDTQGNDGSQAAKTGQYGKYDSLEALLEGHANLETAFGARSIPPKDGGEYVAPTVENFQFDNTVIDSLREGFIENNFSQEQVDFVLNSYAANKISEEAVSADGIQQQLDTFKQEKGEEYAGIEAKANKMVDAINDPALNELLNNPLYGNNPVLINALAKLAEVTNESTMHNDAAASGGMSKEQAQAKLAELVPQYTAEMNHATKQALRVEMDKLHDVLSS